ncbi:hypothetical protein [Cryobacterium levicorallinum]|uniref:Uncharacterized protein n=1 Tax=Cryobacterium levicorallinum TaxID=995038 RepID=A0ABY1EAF6_9MICO|nr:hypothetical protein [Cryobacterium levicorallinum]GEP27623.1 hypothetical protein CLE01_22210 [Cryobacterium levicorallinum]SFH27376.1 hypothetical protein SAMN05216274_102238 [Cryobacterium levicorallinum]
MPVQDISHLHAEGDFDPFNALKYKHSRAAIKNKKRGRMLDCGARTIAVEDTGPDSAFVIHRWLRLSERVEIARESVVANGLEEPATALLVMNRHTA